MTDKEPTKQAVAEDKRNWYMGKCYDCGSDQPGHHTELCDLAPSGAVRDLPSIEGTQWWDKEANASKRTGS